MTGVCRGVRAHPLGDNNSPQPGTTDVTTEAKVYICKMVFVCDQRWQDLNQIDGVAAVRFCTQCQEAVHLCDSPEQIEVHHKQGHCVAITDSTLDPGHILGMPAPPQELR